MTSMRCKRILLLVLALPLGAWPLGAGETYRPAPASWQERMQKDVDSGRVPGAMLLVSSPEWGMRVAAAGRAAVGDSRPIGPDTPLRVGPVTRTMVSIALLQMESEWKVRLDQTLAELLGDGVHPKSDKVTLRDCLRMTSGVFNYRELPEFAVTSPVGGDNASYTPEQILARVVKQQPELVVAPGTYAYSDTDYLLAGLVAEKIDGEKLDAILQRRVFSRCGMANTWFDKGLTELPEGMAHGYTCVKAGELADRTRRNASADWAAGAVVSTPADMLRFWRALFASETLLTPYSYARMTKFVTDWTGRPEDARGLGLMERLSDRGTFRGIDGEIPGYYVCMGHYLHRDTYILLFINSSDSPWVGRQMYDNLLRQISGAPNRMVPADKAEVSGAKQTLAWSAGLLYGTKYAVYVGESFEAVERASAENPGGVRVFWTDKRTFTQDVDGLSSGKTYVWRVDAVRERPEYELKNDRKRFERMRGQYPDMEYDFIPETETIRGPTFQFTVK